MVTTVFRSTRARTAILIVFFASILPIIGSPMPAYAEGPGSIRAPFTPFEEWYVCQGYNSPPPYLTHHDKSGTDHNDNRYALDLVASAIDVGLNGCNPNYGYSSTNKSVIAPANGSVAWSRISAGTLCLNLSDGGSLMFAHLMERLPDGARVAAGITQIGIVAPPGQAGNNGIAHIHIQAHSRAGCVEGTIPFDFAHGFRFCSNTDLSSIGGEYQHQGKRLWGCGSRMTGNDWLLTNHIDSSGSELGYTFGRSGAIPLAGDWDGDGDDTPGYRYGNTFCVINSKGDTPYCFDYGSSSDIPVVGNWDGYKGDTVGVRRGDTFLLTNHWDGTTDIKIPWGRDTDRPLAGDWNGDGKDTVGLRRGNMVYITNDTQDPVASDATYTFERSGDILVVGDWDGDGGDTVGVFRAGSWYLTNSRAGNGGDGEIPSGYGNSTDTPIVGDWDGHIGDTIGVVR
jgi:hypothetical protein